MTPIRRYGRRPPEERYRRISVAIRPGKNRARPHTPAGELGAYSAAAFAGFLAFDQTVRQHLGAPSDDRRNGPAQLPGAAQRGRGPRELVQPPRSRLPGRLLVRRGFATEIGDTQSFGVTGELSGTEYENCMTRTSRDLWWTPAFSSFRPEMDGHPSTCLKSFGPGYRTKFSRHLGVAFHMQTRTRAIPDQPFRLLLSTKAWPGHMERTP